MTGSTNKYQFAKKELLKMFIAIFVLMLVSVTYYFYIRREALHLAEKRAEITLQNTENTFQVRMGKIETIVNVMRPMAEYALDDPDAMFDIPRHAVESSSLIMGTGIAFKADYYPEKGRWFETYVGHHKGCDKQVTEQIGCAEHDYLNMDWYQQGLASEKGCWTAPYYDNAGGMDYIISYCVPIRDASGEAVGLIIADVTLDTLASIVRSIKLYPHSYCMLVSNNGDVLVPPPASAKTKSKAHVYTEEIDGKNMTLIITVPDSDMYRRLRRSSLFFALVALTGVFTVFIISYRSMLNLWQLNEVRTREQHIEDELAIARNIQQSLLPSASATKPGKNIDVSGLQVPARFVGGDLYDYHVRDNKMLFCIGDVSGKGVPAAMLMTIAHSLFRTLTAHSDDIPDIMHALNEAISDNNPDLMFITMFLGIMDLETGKISYCNAGHNPPILVRKGGAEFVDTEPCLLFGVDMRAKYTVYELVLNPGDSLFLYTDGLTEAENVNKELFGEERALKIADGFVAMTAQDQVDTMRQAVREYTNGAEQSDDLTMLAVRYMPATETLTLFNDLLELERLEPFLEGFFSKNSLDPALLPRVDLALEEALANVIMYAYPEGSKGEVTLITKAENDMILFEMSDSGVPFNPLQQKEADLDVPLKERQIGGLGIHLIKEIMDEVEYARVQGKNVLRMRKKVSG
jgi:anti-sigma regulatory factor (Ser/Thr protein kinase)